MIKPLARVTLVFQSYSGHSLSDHLNSEQETFVLSLWTKV